MLRIIFELFIFIVLIILQFVFPTYFYFGNIYPNFILIYIVYLGLNKGSIKGETFGFIYGFVWDIITTDIFGLKTLTFTISGYLSGIFNKNLDNNQTLTQFLVMFIVLLIEKCSTLLIYLIMSENIDFSVSSLLSMLITLVIAPFAFKLLSIIDNKI